MHNMVLGTIAAVATAETASTVDTIIQQGASLGTLAPSAIWALISLICVTGLVLLYRDKSKSEQDLKTIIKDSSSAIALNTATLEKLNETIDKCPKR